MSSTKEINKTKEESKSETVSTEKKKRQFQWTEKRKKQFEDMVNKKKKGGRKEKEEQINNESESDQINEQEEKQDIKSKNIMKRSLDPHFLSRKEREKTKEYSSESEEEEEEEEEESGSENDSESSEEVVVKTKKSKKRPVVPKKDWKLQRQLEKLRVKNKQLQSLFVETKLKRPRKKYDPESSEEELEQDYEDVRNIQYPQPPTARSTPYFFC